MYTKQESGMRRVSTPDGPVDLRIHLIGPNPILMHFLDRMTFPRIVRSCLGMPRKSILDHAQTLCVFIQNIILSAGPLYRIADWADPTQPDALGLTALEKESLNDDRVARSLDALVSPRARSLFFRLALHIIKQFEVDTRRMHHDTTTVTFYGQYKGSFREPRITRGINKDHKPHLKQLVFGLNVSADGAVPISHEVYSGNRTDDTVQGSNVDRLREILGRTDFIYVADSKLCTRKNLEHVAHYGGKFVTVLPRSCAEDQMFRKALREGSPVRWRLLWEIENTRRKSELEVAPVYLKKPRRAAGLVHAVFLSMMLSALSERTARQGMKREGVDALAILPEGRSTRIPDDCPVAGDVQRRLLV